MLVENAVRQRGSQEGTTGDQRRESKNMVGIATRWWRAEAGETANGLRSHQS